VELDPFDPRGVREVAEEAWQSALVDSCAALRADVLRLLGTLKVCTEALEEADRVLETGDGGSIEVFRLYLRSLLAEVHGEEKLSTCPTCGLGHQRGFGLSENLKVLPCEDPWHGTEDSGNLVDLS
jgi:hypothetical protein